MQHSEQNKIRWVVITLVLATKLLSLYFKVLKDCVTLGQKIYTVETEQAVMVVCIYSTKIVVLKIHVLLCVCKCYG